MPDDDLYAVLGVAPSATPEEVRRAYRALMRRYHPDTWDGRVELVGGEALQRVVAAYAVLGDPQARADYDRSRPVAGTQIEVRRRRSRPEAGEDAQPAIWAGAVRWRPSSRR